MLIETGTLTPKSLEGQVAIVTGAGRGIGFETARALIWLGAKVIIAEIDKSSGREAASNLDKEFGEGRVMFIHVDVGSERSIEKLKSKSMSAFSKVDIVVNNATITPMGAVKDLSISEWDASYRVNLRGPVLLARAFLPAMLERDCGVFVCVSSVGEAYMGAYETFKTAQAHLANTLDAELEGTRVHAFTIEPGLVHTPGAQAGIEELAPLYGKTVEEFYAISQEHMISVEAAGAGFATAVALAPRFRGQEPSSKQALIAAGIDLLKDTLSISEHRLTSEALSQALLLCRRVRKTLAEQSKGWANRSLFERQWMFRDFKKNAGMTVEQWLEILSELEIALDQGDQSAIAKIHAPIDRLVSYYKHMQELARGYEKDPQKLEKQLRIIQEWQDDADQLKASLTI